MKRKIISADLDQSSVSSNYLEHWCRQRNKVKSGVPMSIEIGNSPDELVFVFKNTWEDDVKRYIKQWARCGNTPSLNSEIEIHQTGDYRDDWVEGSAHFKLSDSQRLMFRVAENFPNGLFDRLLDISFPCSYGEYKAQALLNFSIEWGSARSDGFGQQLISTRNSKFEAEIEITSSSGKTLHYHEMFGDVLFGVDDCGSFGISFVFKNDEDLKRSIGNYYQPSGYHTWCYANSVDEMEDIVKKIIEDKFSGSIIRYSYYKKFGVDA